MFLFASKSIIKSVNTHKTVLTHKFIDMVLVNFDNLSINHLIFLTISIAFYLQDVSNQM